jgi:F0F1-type ATP synthase membrane subunit c/vacuolar-type H+-ATPase subunit K
MDAEAAKMIGAGLAAIGMGLASLGVGNVFAKFLEGCAARTASRAVCSSVSRAPSCSACSPS